MTNQSSISVVLPNFNHGAFVGRALRALLSQSPAPNEVIVVDDASTDNSRSIIEEVAVRNPPVRLLANPQNIGVIRAQKRGLEVATGRYIYLAAADDWVMPGFFALALEMLRKYAQAGLFCGDAILIDGQSGRCRGYRPVVRPFHHAGFADGAQTRRILQRCDNWILTGSTLFRRDAFEIAGGLDETLGTFADGYLARRVALIGGFCYAPRVVAAWRISSLSVSRQASLTIEKATNIRQTMPTRIANDPLFPEWYRACSDVAGSLPALGSPRKRRRSITRSCNQCSPIQCWTSEYSSAFAGALLDLVFWKGWPPGCARIPSPACLRQLCRDGENAQ